MASYPYPNQPPPPPYGGYPAAPPAPGPQVIYVTQPGMAYDPNSSVQYVVQQPAGMPPSQVVYQQPATSNPGLCAQLCACAGWAALCCCCWECLKEIC